jgi:hypothetical protein
MQFTAEAVSFVFLDFQQAVGEFLGWNLIDLRDSRYCTQTSSRYVQQQQSQRQRCRQTVGQQAAGGGSDTE